MLACKAGAVSSQSTRLGVTRRCPASGSVAFSEFFCLHRQSCNSSALLGFYLCNDRPPAALSSPQPVQTPADEAPRAGWGRLSPSVGPPRPPAASRSSRAALPPPRAALRFRAPHGAEAASPQRHVPGRPAPPTQAARRCPAGAALFLLRRKRAAAARWSSEPNEAGRLPGEAPPPARPGAEAAAPRPGPARCGPAAPPRGAALPGETQEKEQ